MRVLYTHTSALIGGGNMVLLNLLRKIDRTLIEPVSVLPEPGPLETRLQELDVPYFILDLRPRSKLDTALALGALAIKAMRHTMDILHANDPTRTGSLRLELAHSARGSCVTFTIRIRMPTRCPGRSSGYRI
jgi:hypothetical protein